MYTIGWGMLLMVLIIGLYFNGISLGLLSGLVLGLLTFSVQPAPPPNALILLQTTWFLLMATLEATGFFYLLTRQCKAFLAEINDYYGVLMALLCYGLVFLIGDKKWLYPLISDQNALEKGKARLLFPIAVAGHMALLASPLSISGILLIVVTGNSGLPILNLLGRIGMLTLGITAASSGLVYLIPNRWLSKLCAGFNGPAKHEPIEASNHKVQLLFLLLIVAEWLFVSIQPKGNGSTQLSSMDKIFPVKFSIFFPLAMLSMAAVIMLWSKIKPAKILQSDRFKLGIQQLFIFLGLTWLLDSLLIHDKAYCIKIWCDGKVHYGLYLVAVLYMLLIDIPITIWLFSTLWIEHNCALVMLPLWLVAAHSLTPIKSWIMDMLEAYKNKQ